MLDKKSFEAVDFTLRDLRDEEKLMGGIPILCCGDFR